MTAVASSIRIAYCIGDNSDLINALLALPEKDFWNIMT